MAKTPIAASWTANSTSPYADQSHPNGDRVSGSIEGVQLASGHYVDQQLSMTVISPRPDSDTGVYGVDNISAKHRWAYYDGVNPVRYEEPIKVQGGSAPFRYEIIQAPSGATIEGVYGDPTRHGVVKWTPSQAYTTGSPATFQIRVHGQDGNTIDATWTCATSSSTSQFVFIDSVSGDDANSGSISAPKQTLASMTGATTTTTTFPYATVYLRAGSYATSAHSDGWTQTGDTGNVRFICSAGYQPQNYISFPDEAVTIDFSAAEFYTDADLSDWTWRGSTGGQLTISGSADNAAETHNFWIGTSSKRFGWAFVDFDGFIPRVNGNYTNSAPIFANQGSLTPPRQYGYAHYVREINRTQASSNDALLWVLFGLQYWCDEYCEASRTTVGGGINFKDTNYDCSSRYVNVDVGMSNGAGFSFLGQTDSDRCEVCYSKIRGPLWLNLQADADTGNLISIRNTVYTTDNNYPEAIRAWAGTGPFEDFNSVLVSNGPAQVNSNVTSTGTEVHEDVSGGDVPINTTTLDLIDVGGGTSWRTTYLGVRGHEIE